MMLFIKSCLCILFLFSAFHLPCNDVTLINQVHGKQTSPFVCSDGHFCEGGPRRLEPHCGTCDIVYQVMPCDGH